MNRGLGFILVITGIILIALGINASHSFGSDVSRFFTGTPTDKAIWLVLGGVASTIAGSWLSLKKA
jgi:hypothetical protein